MGSPQLLRRPRQEWHIIKKPCSIIRPDSVGCRYKPVFSPSIEGAALESGRSQGYALHVLIVRKNTPETLLRCPAGRCWSCPQARSCWQLPPPRLMRCGLWGTGCWPSRVIQKWIARKRSPKSTPPSPQTGAPPQTRGVLLGFTGLY